MPQAQRLIDRAIDGIADGAPVDWDALDRQSPDDERELVKYLRILAGIAELHRSTVDRDPDASLPPSAQEPLSHAGSGAAGDPESWGRYRLLEKIGEGSFGSVYRAWDPELEREIAVKILRDRVTDTNVKGRLLSEGRALARIDHANVVRVLGVEDHGDRIGLCMEFVRGETLESLLRTKGTLNAREAVLVGEDVCRALSAVHVAGFVHRDVKAQNVMRARDGRIVLMDFGTGRQAVQLKAGGPGMAGTPVYMAPEVLAGLPATEIGDVYSVGVLLYRLVADAFPVEGRSIEELRAAHMQGNRRLLSDRRSDLPMAFTQVVERALAPNPQQRYGTAGALLEALSTIGSTGRKTRVLVRAALVTVAVLFTIGFLGLLTTAFFNLIVGRSAPFSAESPGVWMAIGLSSLFTPVLYVGLMLLAVIVARFGLRLSRLLPPVDRVMKSGEARVSRLTKALNLDDPNVFAQAVATAGLIALAVILWRFADLLRAFTAFPIGAADPEELLPLRWDKHRVDPSMYRAALDVLILGFGAALFRIRRLRFRQSKPGSQPMVPVAILLGVTTLLLEAPYRLGWRAEGERVELAGERCYLLGLHDVDGLVYCPDKTASRTQVIKLNDPVLRRLGVTENIFSPPDSDH